LLRMTSGLALDDINNAFYPSSRMLYTEPDMAAYAERFTLVARPGRRYHYSNLSTLILSRIVRDAVGGRPEDVLRFAGRELFGPLGMRGVTLEFDMPARRSAPRTATPPAGTGRASACSICATASSGTRGSCPRAGSSGRRSGRRDRATATRPASSPTAARAMAASAASSTACRPTPSTRPAPRASGW